MIDRFLNTTYKPRGRGPHEYDCWGLVRAVRHELFDKPLLPSFDSVDPLDKKMLTKCYRIVYNGGVFSDDKKAGAIATAWWGKLCVHVGVLVEVDGRLWVLETDEPTGPVLTNVSRFESRYGKIVYYDD